MDNISEKLDINFVHVKKEQDAIWNAIKLFENNYAGGQMIVKNYNNW